ncbi:hypothetical protein ACN4EE_20710 [Geminocystis sp. CENA526]|uniref:hypothetical protein n=1 Tax=Geminocystis sp. CENA526 TaxID=1355871 RepID=UPI003D6E1698
MLDRTPPVSLRGTKQSPKSIEPSLVSLGGTKQSPKSIESPLCHCESRSNLQNRSNPT